MKENEELNANIVPDEEANLEKLGLDVGIEQKLSPGKTFILALQHIFVSNVWLDPVFVAAMIGLPLALSANLVNAIFIAAGLVTLTQATKLAKLPIIQGPSAAFDVLLINAGTAGTLAAAMGGIFVSGIIAFILSVTGVVGHLGKLFTKCVTGSVITVVGLALASFALYEFLGGAAGEPMFLNKSVLTVSIITAGIVMVLSMFGKGFRRTYAFIIAVVVGDILAGFFGMIDIAQVSTASWIGLPKFMPYGTMEFHIGAIITFFIAYCVAMSEAMGVYTAASELTGRKLTKRTLKFGFAGEAVGSMVSSLIGGFTTTAYAQNVGVMRMTRVASRHPIVIAGIIFLILGFCPKAGALLAITPGAVVGGIFLPASAAIIYTGIEALSKMEKTEANYMTASFAIMLAMCLPGAITGITGYASDMLTNKILVGAIAAIVFQALFSIGKKKREQLQDSEIDNKKLA